MIIMKNRILWLLLAIILSGVLTSWLTSCSDNDDNKDGDKKSVVILLPDASSIARWAVDRANLESVMKSYGFQTHVHVAPETAKGAEQQVQQLKDAIANGAEYIVLTAIDYKRINASGVLQEHPDVQVVCHDRFVLDNPNIAYFSSTDTREIGRMQAMFLLNHFHSKGDSHMTVEFLEGPDTDVNAKDYFEGAMELLKQYIDNGDLEVKSGKKTYSQVKSDSWNVSDGKKAMQDRLESYGAGECPDMILAANDNLAQGAIEALGEAGITDMPVITGQDNTATAQANIRSGKQTMTIDKNLKDMAYNTAMIINSLISKSPVHASESVSGVPTFYSKTTLVTIDSY